MPNFSFLAPTEVEFEPLRGVNEDPPGRLGVMRVGSTKKNQFEIICTSLKPNFSFLDQTGAEVAN